MWDFKAEDLMNEEDFAPIWGAIISKARQFGYRPFLLLEDSSRKTHKDYTLQTIGFMQLRYPMPSDDVWLVKCKVPIEGSQKKAIEIDGEMHLRYTDLSIWKEAAFRARREVYKLGGKYDRGLSLG